MKASINISTPTIRKYASRMLIQRLKDLDYDTKMITHVSGFQPQYINRVLKELGYKAKSHADTFKNFKKCLKCMKIYGDNYNFCPFDATQLMPRDYRPGKLKIYWNGNRGISILEVPSRKQLEAPIVR